MNNNKNSLNYIPLLAAICIVLGVFLGRFLYEGESSSLFSISNSSGAKVDEVIEQIVNNYVDPVNENEITEFAINKLLAHLDPHSTYIPPYQVQGEKERMLGKFEGIGIEFRVIEDTLMVVNAIKGGPSEKAGIKAGDRIIGLNKQEIALGKLKTDSLVKLLRGKSGSEAALIVIRPFTEGKITIPVVRGEIPIFSIDANFMLNQEVGYVKINRFSYQTSSEFKEATELLVNKGAKKLIIDVRDNPGGSLNAVIDICKELLPNDRNIVYTKGENEQETYNSSSDGAFKDLELTILINRNSASASEILAGALQDNDRATIIGRRTFGKGLVQSVITLKDQSRIHLTIARYYTPSGRCIQKSFNKDDISGYRHDALERWRNGELYSSDSIKVVDSLKYETLSGRTVYGGGGITPDIFVSLDTNSNSKMLFQILDNNLIRNFAIKFYPASNIKGADYKESNKLLQQSDLTDKFKAYCESKKIQWDDSDYMTSQSYIQNRLEAYILRVKYKNSGYFRKTAEIDNEIIKALKVLSIED